MRDAANADYTMISRLAAQPKVKTPSPILLLGIFFAPLSTCSIPTFTFESSAAEAKSDASSESGNKSSMSRPKRS